MWLWVCFIRGGGKTMKSYLNEREGQLDFFKTFRIDLEEALIENTDGVWNGNLLEFKVNINNVNKVLFQAIKYLSKLRVKGGSIPTNILLISLNEDICYVFDSNDYFDEIHTIYFGAASKDNDAFSAKTEPKVINYSNSNMLGIAELLDLLKTTNFVPINIDENCIVGWAERYYRENPKANKGDFLGDSEGKIKIIGEIRQPKHFNGLILPYTGKTNEKFKYLMDKLNDNLKKKDLGAFYTPTLYCEKGAELVRQAIARVPKGNDYVIIDRCAGTGNLESVLTDEELKHCILSTYEYYEYKVLCERLGDKVKYIIPPIETDDTYDKGFVKNANALSKEYVENELIQKFIQNEKCTIILLENPPYAETTSIEHQKQKKSKTSTAWKNNFVVQEMKKEVKGTVSNDLANAFIWSAFKYYLRQPTDSYIVFSPVKYWKVHHLIDKKFMDGFAVNRKHFHTNINACVMIALWSNEDDEKTKSIKLRAFDIQNDVLVDEGVVSVNRIYETYAKKYFDKRKLTTEATDGILIELNGLESQSGKVGRITPLRCRSIMGYMAVYSSGFDNPDLHSSLLISGRYDGNGFFLRKENYIEKMPMFAASRYVRYNNCWTERTRIMKSGDGKEKFEKDVKSGKIKQQLLKTLLFTTLELQNHMRTLTGSDGVFYRNELCLDTTNGATLATNDLKALVLGDRERELFDLWTKILKEAQKTKCYDSSLTYGVYQIQDELNTTHKNELNETVYDYPVLNGDLSTLRNLIKTYYLEEIVPFLFEYEFLK